MLKCSDRPKHIWTVYVFQCNQSHAAILSGQIYWPCFSISLAAAVPHPCLYLRNGSLTLPFQMNLFKCIIE